MSPTVPSFTTTRDSRMMMRYAGRSLTRGSRIGRISSAAVASRIVPLRCRSPRASTYPLGNSNGCSVTSMSGPLDALVRQHQGVDGDVGALGVEPRPLPLAGPGLHEVPARHLHLVGLVVDDDGPVLADDHAVHDLLAPVPQLAGGGDAPLERDVGVGGLAGQLVGGCVVAALAVLDHLGGGAQPGALGEAALGDAVELHEVVKDPQRVNALAGLGHGRTSYASLVSEPPSHIAIRTITNSAGFTGAIMISMITWPSAWIDGGLSSAS